jgi:hypothetical protein
MMDCFFRTKNLRPLRRVWATSNAMISFVCTDPALHAETSARPLVRLVGSIACPRRLGLALVTGGRPAQWQLSLSPRRVEGEGVLLRPVAGTPLEFGLCVQRAACI